MTGNIGDAHEMVAPNQSVQDLRQQASPEELAQGGLDPNHDPSFGDQAPRKRSKVSRACDECRRKKVTRLIISTVRAVDVAKDSLRCDLGVRSRAMLEL